MKLLNGDKLIYMIQNIAENEGMHPAGKELLLDIVEKCTLSPAELADENLKALAVLEELKLRIACAKKNTNSAYQPCAYSAYDTIDRIIKELESDIGIDIDTKVREKARKWEIISDIIAVSPARETVTYGELYQAFVVDEDELLAQSKKPRKEVPDEQKR